ncbi:MAG: hypothetical protein U9R47_04550 [Actinomycetota bacterium]|nr:hypothetical protein [Actinomycetota bacterium]
MPSAIDLSLDAVIAAVTDGQPRLLTVSVPDRAPSLPSGPLDTDTDATLEIGLRRWVHEQTGLDLGYVEQLYTFGDRDRYRTADSVRHLSIAYLALVREGQPSGSAEWHNWYELLPWEDRRGGEPAVIVNRIVPHLRKWSAKDADRTGRVQVTFGLDGVPWDPIRTLDRYELLYEADLVAEAYRDRIDSPPPEGTVGIEMNHDHRRIIATAIGRLRGKLTYRPVVFEVMSETFTLSGLQRTVESLIGVRVHKQNFRRLVERGNLVEGTRMHAASTGGRPAELFRFRREVVSERPRPGVGLPRPRR